MANILNIETSTDVCSVALTSDGQVLDHTENYEGQTHATLLSKYVQEMLKYARSRELKLDAIAVSIGPVLYGPAHRSERSQGPCFWPSGAAHRGEYLATDDGEHDVQPFY